MNQKIDIEKLKISPETTINDAMKILDQTGQKCLLVTNAVGKLLGTLTDGDIRRKIVAGSSTNVKVDKISNADPIKLLNDNFEFSHAKKIMIDSKITLIPVVNKSDILIDYVTIDQILDNDENDIADKINIPVVIMAGGTGNRLKPFTDVLPKPLLPINGKTILEHIINRFEAIGCNDFYFTLNYKSKIMKAYIDDLNPNYNVHFIEENKPLGTAGSLQLIEKKFDKPIFVTNCDIIIKTDYKNFYNYHLKGKYDLSIVAASKSYEIPYGTCQISDDGLLVGINEKPKYEFLTNTGLYLLNPDLLSQIPKDTFFHITDLIKKIIKDGGKVGVFPVSAECWLDVGQWKDYELSKNKI